MNLNTNFRPKPAVKMLGAKVYDATTESEDKKHLPPKLKVIVLESLNIEFNGERKANTSTHIAMSTITCNRNQSDHY